MIRGVCDFADCRGKKDDNQNIQDRKNTSVVGTNIRK